jgi:hypothetical protein
MLILGLLNIRITFVGSMKKPLFIFSIIFTTFFTFGQSRKNVTLKIYNLATIDQEFVNDMNLPNSTIVIPYFQPNTQWFKPTIAVQWNTQKGNAHEIELTSLTTTKKERIREDPGPIWVGPWGGPNSVFQDEHFNHFALRYEYIVSWIKKEDMRLKPTVGVGAMPFFMRSLSTPHWKALPITQETFVGLLAFVTPRVSYDITEKIGLDLNIPIAIINAYYFDQITTYEWPEGGFHKVLPKSDVVFFPKYYSLRLGFTMKI